MVFFCFFCGTFKNQKITQTLAQDQIAVKCGLVRPSKPVEVPDSVDSNQSISESKPAKGLKMGSFRLCLGTSKNRKVTIEQIAVKCEQPVQLTKPGEVSDPVDANPAFPESQNKNDVLVNSEEVAFVSRENDNKEKERDDEEEEDLVAEHDLLVHGESSDSLFSLQSEVLKRGINQPSLGPSRCQSFHEEEPSFRMWCQNLEQQKANHLMAEDGEFAVNTLLNQVKTIRLKAEEGEFAVDTLLNQFKTIRLKAEEGEFVVDTLINHVMAKHLKAEDGEFAVDTLTNQV